MESAPPAYETLYNENNTNLQTKHLNVQKELQQLPFNPDVQASMGTKQLIVTTIVPLGPKTTSLSCPHCHAYIMTKVKKTPGTKAWVTGIMIAFLGCLCGCFLGCCLIPCCTDSCRNTKHTCPKCKGYIGQHKN